MSADVKSRRRYDSPRRRAQAEATRAVILDAARRLLERDGYAATTMAAVAAEAGVALKTVYLAFNTKSGLTRAVWDVLLRGPVDRPVAEHGWYREVLDEPDPWRKLALNARNSRRAKARIGSFFAVIRDAAAADGDMAALWSLIEADFHANQRVIVQTLADGRALRRGLDVERATDILWTLNHPDTWRALVAVRRWPPARYERWLAESSATLLLAPVSDARRRPSR